jgi:hypothetical protein
MTEHVATLKDSDIPASEYSLDFVLGSIKGALERGMSAKARDLWMPSVKEIDKIHVMEGLNVRVNDADLQAHVRKIADSMKVNGFKTSKPLEVFVVEKEDGSSVCYLADGHCRLAALRIALNEGAKILNIPIVTLPHQGHWLAGHHCWAVHQQHRQATDDVRNRTGVQASGRLQLDFGTNRRKAGFRR